MGNIVESVLVSRGVTHMQNWARAHSAHLHPLIPPTKVSGIPVLTNRLMLLALSVCGEDSSLQAAMTDDVKNYGASKVTLESYLLCRSRHVRSSPSLPHDTGIPQQTQYDTLTLNRGRNRRR